MEDPLFKGCTRPPMLLGIPMVPFVLLTGLFVLLSMYLFTLVSPLLALFLLLIYLPICFWMRLVTQRDDQRLLQLILRLRLRLRMRPVQRRWGAVTYSPHSYRRKPA